MFGDEHRGMVLLLSDKDDLSTCDFKGPDGLDSSGVDHFIHKKASDYRKYNLSVIHIVKYDKEIVGFFTASMGALEVEKMKDSEKITEVPQLHSYPGLHLGYMGVERKFTRKGIGTWICKYCIGLAVEHNNKVACGYVFLQTIPENKEFYEKSGFMTSEKLKKGKIWMYRRIFNRLFVRTIREYYPTSENVTSTKTVTASLRESYSSGEMVSTKVIRKDEHIS